MSPGTLTSCFCAIMLNSSEENHPKGELQGHIFNVGLSLQTEAGLQVFCPSLYGQNTLDYFFPPNLSIKFTYLPSHVPICILHLLMPQLFPIWKPQTVFAVAWNSSTLEQGWKKFLKCQQSTKCPSHTSSQGINKKVTENLSTKNAWLCPPSVVCRKCSNTEDTPDLELWEKEQSEDYERSCWELCSCLRVQRACMMLFSSTAKHQAMLNYLHIPTGCTAPACPRARCSLPSPRAASSQ